MRAIERHGGGQILERAFLGFAALPENAGRTWREVLGITLERPTLQLVEDRFRALVKMYHPDVTGEKESDKFREITAARDAARMELSA
jgi:hypothetical protein